MSLELVPLCTARVSLTPAVMIPGGPMGTRLIVEVKDMEVEGERLRARMSGAAAADWATLSPDGTIGSVDVRVTLETHDGAIVFAHYGGRLDLRQTPPVVYVAPRFETGDPRYDWLARMQAVAKGTVSDDLSTLTYEMYELK